MRRHDKYPVERVQSPHVPRAARSNRSSPTSFTSVKRILFSLPLLSLSLFLFPLPSHSHPFTHPRRRRETSSLRALTRHEKPSKPSKILQSVVVVDVAAAAQTSPDPKPFSCHPSIHPVVDCRIISRSRVKQARASQSWIDGWKTRGWRSKERESETTRAQG